MNKNLDKNGTISTKPDKKKIFINSLANNSGHISNTCKAINIGRQTYYNWIEDDNDFKEQCENVSESLLDNAEDKLQKLINDNNITAIIFFLKTKGRKRGYSESTQLELVRPIGDINFNEI